VKAKPKVTLLSPSQKVLPAAASGAAFPGLLPCYCPSIGFRFKAPYSPAIAFFPSKTMFGISRARKAPISDCGAFSDERAEGFA